MIPADRDPEAAIPQVWARNASPRSAARAVINAIVAEDDLKAGESHYLALNKELSRQWPVITEKKDGLPDAKSWEGKPDKLKLLER